jgi:hypothetical protein
MLAGRACCTDRNPEALNLLGSSIINTLMSLPTAFSVWSIARSTIFPHASPAIDH